LIQRFRYFLVLDKNPLCRVVPVENSDESNTEEAFSYVKEKYREMILDAAETVLGYFWI
jgi:hypothetical protein